MSFLSDLMESGTRILYEDYFKIVEYSTSVEDKITSLISEAEAEVEVVTIDEIEVSQITLDFSSNSKHRLILSEDVVLNFTDPSEDAQIQILIKRSDATSTITFPTTIKWASGEYPEFSTEVDAIDIVNLFYSLADDCYYAMAGVNFSVV